METILKKANKYKKNKNWKKAIKHYEKYLKNTNKNEIDEIYISYAVSLKKSGNILKAKKILLNGIHYYPENQHMLIELYNIYNNNNEKLNAVNIAKKLIELAPDNSQNYFRLGTSYAQLNKKSEAEKEFLKGLEYYHNININDLKQKIQKDFSDNYEEVATKYVFLGGRSNYGAFVHKFWNRKLITKISKYDINSKRERMFYEEVIKEFPRLKKHVPYFISSKKMDNMLYLTIELVERDNQKTESIKSILSTSEEISSIPYEEIVKKFPNINYSYRMSNKPNPLTVLFTRIHEENYNNSVFTSMYDIIEQNNYPSSTHQVIKKIETLIMNYELYKFIDPSVHYSLLHGDYNKSNSIINKSDKLIKVIDWELFKIGPHFMDIARYLSGSLKSYSEVKKIYLDNIELGGKLTLIERIFFLYALILLYILTFRERKIEQKMTNYINPALRDLEKITNEFLESDYYKILKKQFIEKENQDLKIKKLQEQNKIIKKSYNNLIKSKSWKITYPFRKLREILSK